MTPKFVKNSFALSSRMGRSALRVGALSMFAVLMVAPLHAREYVAYPGSYPAKVKSVESAAQMTMEVPVWTGFVRDFSITLPDVSVPRNTGEAPECERQLAERAKKFTESFLAQGGRLQARDLTMTDSADKNAKAGVFSEAGDSLTEALRSEGLARAIDVGADVPWCGAK